jgi:hypothetical protein
MAEHYISDTMNDDISYVFRFITMKRTKYHIALMFHKIKHNSSTNTKFQKGFLKRTRNYLESKNPNCKWEYNVISRNMISAMAVSRLNTISSN